MTYQFPFAVVGEPNEGDVATWDGEKWVPEPGAGAAATWSESLAEGNITGGFSPTISDGDALFFEAVGIIEGTGALSISIPDGITLDTPSVLFASGVASAVIGIADSPTANGVILRILGQNALQAGDTAGNVELMAGSATAANGIGGGLHIGPGLGGAGGQNGTLNITNGSGTSVIFIEGESVAADAAIHLATGGLAFWDGTPAVRPSVTDLPTLLAALDSMGLITDDSP